ncbi:pyridoxamine 5'-phosphate oxidase family protein [Corynebacterium poyangense]|uniref:Pyridoxamine 5'-phosphate oxidase family protein n=1 Tax=Corynebacterium poyangense TaxID=2684405 RepID=A0A7H0SQT9_9CORY|nr:pyridoxamine 5'-phosphate oxidase family protein [Corynebacterium poyangense]QNQ90914.1 pyridoxamine 5'-phosphate oxidase family protein [Corynebacterium poyangense]
MSFNGDVFEVLDREACLERLKRVQLGRVVVRRSDEMDIFPVNYVVDNKGDIYFRTAEGSKLFTINLNHDVLFEADDREGEVAWSVVVKANAEIVEDQQQRAYADQLPLKPWAPTLKYNWVRISTEEDISGREFEVAEEPERY